MTDAAPLRRVTVSPDTLADALRAGDGLRASDPLPAGATLVDSGRDARTGEFYLTFEHRSWTLVPAGEDIPTLDVDLEGSP